MNATTVGITHYCLSLEKSLRRLSKSMRNIETKRRIFETSLLNFRPHFHSKLNQRKVHKNAVKSCQLYRPPESIRLSPLNNTLKNPHFARFSPE